MSDQPNVTTGQMSNSTDPTAGMLLRKAREATGLHIAALAVAIKVPVKKLEALEADRLGELPDAVFVRALAGSMCRALKIDPAPVLSRLPQSVLPKLDRDVRGINMPFRSQGMLYGSSLWSFVSRPAALWVIGLLVAALLVLYLPEVHTTAWKAEGAPATAIGSPVNPVDVRPPAGPGAASGVDAPVVAASSMAVVVAAPDKAASEPVAATVSPVAAPSSAPAQLPVAVSNLLEFRAKSQAWVRVSDAKGVIQFEKTLAAGEAAVASGAPPLAVVVGNVGATELRVRGQPFNLEEVAKNNVARFEVK
jgi:cytoskeleton protein RodZ